MNRIRLLTLDCFGTLIKPVTPIGDQYAKVAQRHGIKGLVSQDVQASFEDAFRKEQKEYPMYGKAVGMKPSDWWANVIRSTFRPFTPPSASIPESLIFELWARFSSGQGYQLYKDIPGFFQTMRLAKQSPDPTNILSSLTVGVITNSDDRVCSVLSSLGLRVGPRRHGMLSNGLKGEVFSDEDINFVVTSYDVGVEKPDMKIFDAARALGSMGRDLQPSECLHVGDKGKEDFQSAQAAGWKSLLLARDVRRDHITKVRNFSVLKDVLKLHGEVWRH